MTEVCGITGFIDSKARTAPETLTRMVERMTERIIHRGPDDLGLWTDPDKGVALGFRRLAILDLTPEGHQPMLSSDGNLTLIFNGEIYNYLELRAELAALGHRFRGHSDTEVILAAFLEWGLEASVTRFNGMFAMALWDRAAGRLHLFRDRIGKKPLYYGWQGDTFFFGSQMAAFRVHPDFRGTIDRDALALYLRHNYVPGPHSIFEGIRKLTPGAWLTVDPGAPGSMPEPRAYWNPCEVIRASLRRRPASMAEAVEELHGLLLDATAKRMIADVPVGAFLSGGIDSSLVVALMQAQSARPVRTFTIGFHEGGFDEAPYAKAVAAHLGTDHTEVYLSGAEALAVVPTLPAIFDEPFSDSSQIPTWLVSQVARRDVTVALSGDGGDELFAGYNLHRLGLQAWRMLGWIPGPLRKGLSRSIKLASPQAWNRVLGKSSLPMPGFPGRRVRGEHLHRMADFIDFRSFPQLYRRLMSHWEGADIVLGSREGHSPFTAEDELPRGLTKLQMMQYLDFIQYLPNDILVKVDRASMAVSLEARSPILDYRVVEHAWRFPDAWKSAGKASKLPLRQILAKYVPAGLVDRPKQGFGIPLAEWLRGPLRPWAEALLAPERLKRDGLFDPAPILAQWSEHKAGTRDRHYPLWDVLMFNAWLDAQ